MTRSVSYYIPMRPTSLLHRIILLAVAAAPAFAQSVDQALPADRPLEIADQECSRRHLERGARLQMAAEAEAGGGGSEVDR